MKRAIVLIIVFFAYSFAQADNTIVLTGIGKQTPIRRETIDRVEYLSASDLFAALGSKGKWNEKEAEYTASVSGHKMVFTLSSMFCSVDGRSYNLVHAPRFHVDDLYLPVNQTLYLLSDVLDRVISYDKKKSSISASGKHFNVVGASLEEKVNGDLLEIMLTRELKYEVFISEGNWINVTIPGGLVDPRSFETSGRTDKVIDTRAFQFDNAAQVSIQVRQDIKDFHTNFADDPERIQISLERADFLQGASDTTQPARHDQFDPIDVIVIDAGHGGDHDGAVGRDGLKEKDVTLDIAIRLQQLFQKDGRFKVMMTRLGDETVGLEERASAANNAQGDIFISIHANSSENRSASGSEVYFLAAAKSDEARITELLENSDFDMQLPDAPRRGKEELDYIVMDVLQTEYLSQSRELAEFVGGRLKEDLAIRARGINQAGFRVLNHVRMPGVLVEVAFISNKIEERLLGQDDFRQEAAESIHGGILSFIERYEKEARANGGSE